MNGSTTKIITDAGIEELLWAGVRAELDMRDQSNAPMPSGESRHSYLGSDYPIYNVDQGYRSRIATFADAPQSIMGIKKLIEWFKQDKPVYLHCSVEDEGTRYRTGVYYAPDTDAATVELLRQVFKEQQQALEPGQKLAVELLPLKNFYRAEEYHQDYLDKNPTGYCHLTPALFRLAAESN